MTVLGGRFRIEQQIGSGGMGVVYRALDEQTSRPVAIKLIDRALVGDADVERARREAKTLARLAHEAIVEYVADGVTDDGKLYLAMQWVDGNTVGKQLLAPGFTLREAVTMIGRIAAALGAAHAAGVLHRDVKPSNVLLPSGDPAHAMLIDFGIARDAGAGSKLTRTGTTVGTPGYMAPEQARGLRALTAAVDVFALGCLLFECATARPAFSGTLRSAVMTKVMFADPEPFEVLCPEAPLALHDVLAAMLAKDPQARLADGAAVAAALAQIAIPDGPRRSSRSQVDVPTRRSPSAGDATRVHCLVLAARGQPDEPEAPPSDVQVAELAKAIARWAAEPVVLETGCVVIHVIGLPVEVSTRAAWCALEVRRVLTDASVVITALEPELATLADEGTQLLSSTALAAIFGKVDVHSIVIDPSLAPYLSEKFVIEGGQRPRLLSART